ncbi:MAG: restriction endonuclease subunit S [Phycisphaeraceae bacterium]|nr:restriction endonuclease subunit S [Phycisphaeraceae bacterium]
MGGRYQAYPEYKGSGVEWLGDVPERWELVPLKFLCAVQTGVTLGKDFGVRELECRPYLRVANVQDGYLDLSAITEIELPPNDVCRYELQEGDVLMTEGGDFDKLGRGYIWEGQISGCLHQNHIFAVRPNRNKLVSRFLAAVLSSTHGKNYFTSTAQKTTNLATTNSTKLNNFPVQLPNTLQEQNAIVAFLDYETAKIGALIEKQQQLIKLLKEKRQAVISHAVAKGLDPDAPMKDSGVEWLGEVPEHWDIRTVAHSSKKITNGYVGPTRDILVDEGVSYVQATHIKKGKVNFDDAYFVRKSWSDAHSKSILEKGDVLIVQTGAGTGDIGLVSEKEEGFNCHALIIVQPIKTVISGFYLSMALQSQYGYSKLYSIRTGGMHPHLNCSEVQYVKLPIPPIVEQNQITSFIEEQIGQFDMLVGKQLEAIDLMQERRTALISAAVTGKIDVRNWKAPKQVNNKRERTQ